MHKPDLDRFTKNGESVDSFTWLAASVGALWC